MSEEFVRNLFDQWERVWHEAVTHTSRLKRRESPRRRPSLLVVP